MLVYGQLSKEVNSHEGYTMVGIPGHLHHKTLEDTLIKVIIKATLKPRIILSKNSAIRVANLLSIVW